MTHMLAFVGGIVAFLAFVMAMSRILTMPNAPSYVTGFANSVANLFNGAFGQ